MNTFIFDSIFKNEIQDLINLKRAQGFKYAAEEFALKRIDKYFVDKNIQEKVIIKSVVDEWCLRKTYETQANQNNRISIMRVLCSYLLELGFDVYVPPKKLTRSAPKYNAHIYTGYFYSLAEDYENAEKEFKIAITKHKTNSARPRLFLSQLIQKQMK